MGEVGEPWHSNWDGELWNRTSVGKVDGEDVVIQGLVEAVGRGGRDVGDRYASRIAF